MVSFSYGLKITGRPEALPRKTRQGVHRRFCGNSNMASKDDTTEKMTGRREALVRVKELNIASGLKIHVIVIIDFSAVF